MHRFMLSVFISLLLTSCAPSREAVDKRLALACENAVKALIAASDIAVVQSVSFASDKGYDGVTLRTVTLNAELTENAGLVTNKTYTCSYKEQWNMFGHIAEFYSLEKDGQKYGNIDGHITGDFNDLMKINTATEKALEEDPL